MVQTKIYDPANGVYFNIIDDNISIDVGASFTNNDYMGLRVGDKVYLTLKFVASNIDSSLLKTQDAFKSFFRPFFTLKTDVDNQELRAELIKGEYGGRNKPPSRDIKKTGESTETGNQSSLSQNIQYILTYFVDLSDLDSGEKVINLWVFIKKEVNTTGQEALFMNVSGNVVEPAFEETVIYSSNSFYLHQSLLNHFQRNIANEGIEAARTGLDREKVNFPSYLPVGLQPINPFVTRDVALWSVIRDGTNALSFRHYSDFMDYIFCGGRNPFLDEVEEGHYKTQLTSTNKNLSLDFNNVDAYRALKVATEAFVMASIVVSGTLNTKLKDDYERYLVEIKDRVDGKALNILPYLALVYRKLPDVGIKLHPFEDSLLNYIKPGGGVPLADTCYGLILDKLRFPCFLELIWSYWHEESMMVQGISTIARRFQNIRGESMPDPLANLEIGPLRPLNNLMWGYIQDEQHRLTVRRRAYEYDHHYGITLHGTAVMGLRPADSRSKFLEAFHTLLNLTQKFYRQYDDTTVVADAFPIMNALKEVHMILSEGAHNQFGDLPSTARIEMLMQQYILARPEFREFLPTRQMVAYPEAWMDRVGVLNQLHGWTKTNVLHFRDLAVFGEQIILSIRFGAWSDVFNRDQAANWAIFWRPQIQNYIHAYRAVTGVDLTREDGVIDTQAPSIHLLRRLREQNVRIGI